LVLGCATAPVSTPSNPTRSARPDTMPPRPLPTRGFSPVYPSQLMTVGAQGDVTLRLAIDSVGIADWRAISVVDATNRLFVPSAIAAIDNLRLTPARIDGHNVVGYIDVRIRYRIQLCDPSVTPPEVVWRLDSLPPQIDTWTCRMLVIPGAPPVWSRGHVMTINTITLRGRWPAGLDSSGFLPCRGQKLPMDWPQFVGGRRVLVDDHRVTDWRPLGIPRADAHNHGDLFVEWEGSLTGPSSADSLGTAAFVFKPARVRSAVRWVWRSCPI
jgi:hypothetical protein